MSTEIVSAGYQDVRDYIEATWKYIEVRNSEDAAVIRIGIGDARVTWTHTAGDQTLELTCVLSGDDVDITLPETFASSVLYKVSTSGSPMTAAESFAPFTMSAEGDQLTIKHQVQVPQVV